MKKEFRRGFGLIEILLVLAIIFFFFYKVSNLYFKKTITTAKETESTLSEQGINTASYKTIFDSTKDKVRDYNEKIEEQNKEWADIQKPQGL